MYGLCLARGDQHPTWQHVQASIARRNVGDYIPLVLTAPWLAPTDSRLDALTVGCHCAADRPDVVVNPAALLAQITRLTGNGSAGS